MRSPSGRLIYGWGDRLYPDGDETAYAKALGATGVLLLSEPDPNDTDPASAVAAFGKENVFFWAFPDWFHPDNAASSTALLMRRALRHEIGGIVVDVENAPLWNRATPGQIGNLIRAIRQAEDAGLSVGFTSFPFWPLMRRIANETRAWGSVQIYGRDGNPFDPRFSQWRKLWADAFGEDRMSVSLWAGAGRRSAERQRQYLGAWKNERSVILFQSPVPREGTPEFQAQRSFMVSGASGSVVERPKDGEGAC